ncbi:MAG: hypothetical protein OXH68_02495 [Gammaproteobacteria bacterium]|nr:hypothetical protein [Gammaproteobacteria bacterium]
MTVEPVRLRLDSVPAGAVGTAVGILSTWMPVEHLRLGGDTALAARWHHRSSTDLDFSFTPGTSPPGALFLKDSDDIRKDLHALARDGVIAMDSVVMVGRNHIQFMVGDVPVSFVGTEMFHGDPRAVYQDLAEGESHAWSQALVKPRFEGIAGQVWKQVLWMMNSDLEYVPPLTQREGGGHGH